MEGRGSSAPAALAPLAWCFAAAALFGASTPAAKLLAGSLGPLTTAGLLYLGAAWGVAPAALARRSRARSLLQDRRSLKLLGGAVLAGGVLGPVLMLAGLALAPAASVSLWLNLESVATALLGWLFFREHLGRRTAGALALVVAGSVLLAVPGGRVLAPSAILVALAAICWGLDNHLTALIDGLTPTQATLAKGAVAGSVNLAIGLVLEGVLPSPARAAGLLVVGALGYGASIALYVAGAQQLGATRAQLLFATAPYVGVAVAWAVLREPVLPVQLAAAVLMLGALALLRTEDHGHVHAHDAVTHVHWHRHGDGHHDHAHDDGSSPLSWHSHEHAHEPVTHSHAHTPDLHHRHDHA